MVTGGVTGMDGVDPDATTDIGGWGRYYGGGFESVADVVTDFLGPDADEELRHTVTARYRAAINEAMAGHGVYLRGDDFYADIAAVGTSEDVITQVFDAVDLGGIVDDVENETGEQT